MTAQKEVVSEKLFNAFTTITLTNTRLTDISVTLSCVAEVTPVLFWMDRQSWIKFDLMLFQHSSTRFYPEQGCKKWKHLCGSRRDLSGKLHRSPSTGC